MRRARDVGRHARTRRLTGTSTPVSIHALKLGRAYTRLRKTLKLQWYTQQNMIPRRSRQSRGTESMNYSKTKDSNLSSETLREPTLSMDISSLTIFNRDMRWTALRSLLLLPLARPPGHVRAAVRVFNRLLIDLRTNEVSHASRLQMKFACGLSRDIRFPHTPRRAPLCHARGSSTPAG